MADAPFRRLEYPVFCESGVTPGRRQGCQCVTQPDPCPTCAEFAREMERWQSGRPWLDNDKLVPELHAGGWEHDIRVCVATDNVVEIDKLYGPLVAQPVRVSIEGESWVVERRVEREDLEPGASAWVVVARFPIDGEILGAVQEGKLRRRDPRYTCEAIQSADATRHFRECPLRAEHPK